MDIDKIKASRDVAIKKIMNILSAGDVEKQFAHVTGSYHSSDKFIVSWNGMYKGMLMEYSIDKCDAFYKAYSGCGAIYCRRSLIYEKQIMAYSDIERALIEVGLKLVTKKEKAAFFHKFAIPYNNRLKEDQLKSNTNGTDK